MSGVIDPAREREVVERPASALQISEKAASGILEKFELHRSAGLLLDDHCTGPDPASADQIADPNLDKIAAAQLAVDGKIEERTVP